MPPLADALKQHGVLIGAPAFGLIVYEHSAKCWSRLSIDELLLHPRDAQAFCEEVRREFGFPTVPDELILRSLLNYRKTGLGKPR